MTLLKYFKQTKWQFSLVTALTIINAAFSTLAGIASANALTQVTRLHAQQFFIWIMVMALAYVMYALFSYLITVNQTKLKQQIDKLIRRDVAQKLAQADYQTFHKQTTATYASWLTNDINTINEFGIGDLMLIVQQVSEIFLGAITLAYFQVSLLVTVVILTIIMAIVPNLFSKWLSKRSLELSHANERLVNKINDILDGFNTLFLANLPKMIVKRIDQGSDDVQEHAVNYSKAAGLTQSVTNVIAFLSQVIVLGQSGYLILRHLTPVGTISGAQYFAGTIFAELSGISFNWQEFKSLTPIMNKLASVKTATVLPKLAALSNNRIEIKDLSFTYNGKNEPAFDHLNLVVEPGKKYLLLGDSAAGKSTLLNVISGLLTNYTGTIKLGGTDYANISAEQLHQKISYVEQTPYIFAASLKWNLTLGKEVAESRLKRVISECMLDEVIAHLPAGENTELTNQGSNLSGGQKQRIAVARALLRDTPIYLFDEATSSLDKAASNSLEKLVLTQKDKTVILVTHHLQKQTANLSDQIINLNDR